VKTRHTNQSTPHAASGRANLHGYFHPFQFLTPSASSPRVSSIPFPSPSSHTSGNWCGPNFGSGIPVDAVDAACQRHDNCYDSAVSNSAGNKRAENSAKCACDTDLMNEVNDLKADGATYPLLAEAARTTVDGILTVFKYKCGVVAIYDTFKEAAAQARANREARKAAEAAATAG
jgi:hypothetical protein